VDFDEPKGHAMTTIVLAGCGGISKDWLNDCKGRTDVRIVGLVDLRLDAAEKQRAEFGLLDAKVGTDLDAMLSEVRPAAVFDCTLPEVHADIVAMAARHGCHVLGEKPLAESMPSARAALASADAAGLVYAVMQNRRFDPNIRALRAFLASGAIGQVTTLQSDFFIGALSPS
jgi:predicted dehydrogenase